MAKGNNLLGKKREVREEDSDVSNNNSMIKKVIN